MDRREMLRYLGLTAVVGLSSACGQSRPPVSTGPSGKSAAPAVEQPALIVANSELVVGRNRLLVAIVQDGRPVRDANVTYEIFELRGQEGIKRAEAPAVFRSTDGGSRGLYAGWVSFDKSGPWGVGVLANRSGEPPVAVRATLQVASQSPTPQIGSAAIPSANRLLTEAQDPAEVCSAVPVCEMHTQRVSDALGLSKPLVVVFATPGYCTSQTCAPVVNEVLKVRAKYLAQASFVHVEIFSDPRERTVAQPVLEWRLQSEPWTFVVDRQGAIAERFESITMAEEVEEALSAVL